MADILSKAQAGDFNDKPDLETNPRLREISEPRSKVMKEVNYIVTQCPNATRHKRSPEKEREMTKEEERSHRLMRRMEVFYTFTGLLAPKKLV